MCSSHLSKELAEIFIENLKCKISKEIGETDTITANKYKHYRKGMINMASLKFEGGKCHGGMEAKAMMRHSDIAPESRKKAAKGNPHIVLNKSHLNKSILGLTYEQQCKRYDNRIALLDATTNKNKRKDRVTYQAVEVAVPEDLPRNRYNKFFINVAQILIDEVGIDNFICGDIHYDEEHDYIDAETKELVKSRVHAHFGIVPEFKGQLNAQKLYSRATMRRLNKKIEEMTQREFGCRFMTGEKKKSKQTVDELKNESARLMAEKEKQQLQADNQRLQQENVMLENFLIEKRKEIDTIKSQLDVEITEFKRYRALELQQIDADRQQSRELQQKADNKLQIVKALYNKLLALHNKLLQFDDVYLQYAQDYGAQLGSIKHEMDGLSL